MNDIISVNSIDYHQTSVSFHFNASRALC